MKIRILLAIAAAATHAAGQTPVPGIGRSYLGKLERIKIVTTSFCANSSRQVSEQTVLAGLIVASRVCDGSTLEFTIAPGAPAVTPTGTVMADPNRTGNAFFQLQSPLRTTTLVLAKLVTIDVPPRNSGARLTLSVSLSDQPDAAVSNIYKGNCRIVTDVVPAFQGTVERALRQESCDRALINIGYPTVGGTFAPEYLIYNTNISGGISDSRSPTVGVDMQFWYKMEVDCAAPGTNSSNSPNCLVDIEVDKDLIVSQVIQNAAQDVPLIEGKTTMVRAKLKSLGPKAEGPVKGVLDVEGKGSMRSLADESIAATTGSDLNDRKSTLNFLIPSDWAEGTPRMTVTAELARDADRSNNTVSESIPFRPRTEIFPIHIDQWRVCWVDPVTQTDRCPSDRTSDAEDFLRTILPVANDRFVFFPMDSIAAPLYWPRPLDNPLEFERLARRQSLLSLILARARPNSLHRLFFLVPPALAGGDIRIGGARGNIYSEDCFQDDTEQECFEASGRVLAALVLRAFDAFRDTGTRPINGQGVNILRSLDVLATILFEDSTSGDLLNQYDSSWISSESYRYAYDILKARTVNRLAPGNLARPKPGRPAEPAIETIAISGVVKFDGSSAQLERGFRVPGPPLEPLSPEGAWCIALLRASGEKLDTCFDARAGEGASEAYFAKEAPWYPDIRRISLFRRESPEVELASLEAGEPPVITLLTPQPGDVWESRQTLTWSASDPAGNALTYMVQYSSDGGTTWLPLALDLQESRFDVDTRFIKGGKDVRFRVLASSGLSSSYADTAPIEVRQRPEMTVLAQSLDFRNRVTASGSVLTVAVRNTGSGPLTVTASLPSGSPFSVAPSSAQVVIASGRERLITVQYQPTAAGRHQAELTLIGAELTARVALRGAAFDAPVPSIVVPSTLDFGTVPANGNTDVVVPVKNDGGAKLTIQSVTGSSTVFQGLTTTLDIEPGTTRNVRVRVRPTTGGVQAGRLTIRSNDPTTPSVEIAVSATATQPEGPAIEFTPSSLDFGSVPVNTVKFLDVTVANRGRTDLVLSGATASTQRFSSASTFPIAIASQAQRVVSIRFSPSAAGVETATISFNTNDPANPLARLDVRGTGTAVTSGTPSIAVSPVSIDFGTVSVGSSQSRPLTITNTGTGPLAVSSIRTTAPFTAGPASFASIAPGANAVVTIVFAPVSAGSAAQSLTISSTDPARPDVTLNLTGTGSGSTAQPVTLAIDDGSIEWTLGFPSSGVTGYFINRLTPSRYPATLRAVQVFFPSGELAQGTPVTIMTAAHPAGTGGPSLSGINFTRGNGTIPGVERLVEFAVQPITIQSGDFLVGFSAVNPRDIFPVAVDGTPPFQQRSYLSNDGTTFRLVDGAGAAGNFVIRARVE